MEPQSKELLASSSFALQESSSTALTTLPKRLPPHNIEAEQALIGALLHNNASYEKVSDFLRPQHFATAIHGRIYEAICRLIDRGQIADPVTLKDYLEHEKVLAEIGGWTYLVKLADSVISIINISDYGKIIYDLYLRRELITVGEDVVNEAHQPKLEITAVDLIENLEKKLFDLATTGHAEKSFQPFSQALTAAIQSAESAFKREGHIVGVPTGLRDLDKWLGGLHPSDLLIIAGRPSMGKTGLATNIAFDAAAYFHRHNQKGAVAFFSLEMSAEQLAGRLLAQQTGIPSDKIRRGELHSDDFPKFIDVSRRLGSIPLFIDDTPALSVSALRSRARRLKRQHGLSLIIIDYLQLMQVDALSKRSENRVQEISDISRSLKALAKELEVPVIALSQLSRQVEQRDDKRPQLSDLRESGSIEQDADVVMFIFREEYYEARREPKEGTEKHLEWQRRMEEIHNVAEIIIAKQRHGPIGNIKVFFTGSLIKFSDLAHDSYFPET